MEDRNTNTSREYVELGGYCLMPWIWENTVDLPATKSVEFLTAPIREKSRLISHPFRVGPQRQDRKITRP